MSDTITIDGYQLARNFHGRLKCLGAGSFGVVLGDAKATVGGASVAVKLGVCEDEKEFQDAQHEKILLEIPEHPHIVKLLSFHEHAVDSPSFTQSGALMEEIRYICEEKRAIQPVKHPYPKNMLIPADLIPTHRRYCVLAFEIAGDQDLITWFETFVQEGVIPDTPPDNQLRKVAKQMASALAHMHEHGIVHHDVKGENVVITGAGSAGLSSKLIDFGLARRAADGHPGQTGSAPGAAPEMWRDLWSPATYKGAEEQRVSYKGTPADVWSYGVMFFSLGIGTPPFPSRFHKYSRSQGGPARGASPSLPDCGSARKLWEEYKPAWKALRKPHHEPASLLFDLLEPCLQVAPDSRPTMRQISNHLEANSTGSWGQPSWYQAPAAAPVPASGAKRSREADKFTSLGADDSTGACFRGLSGGDDDADDADDPPIADDAPPPVLRRTGALWPADWKP